MNYDQIILTQCKWSEDEQSVEKLTMVITGLAEVEISRNEDGRFSYRSKLVDDTDFVEAEGTFSLQDAIYYANVSLGVIPSVNSQKQDQIYPFEKPVRKLPDDISRLVTGMGYLTTSGRTVSFEKTVGTIVENGHPASFVTNEHEMFAANGFNLTNYGDNIVGKATVV